MSTVKQDVTRVVLIFPVVSLVYHHSVQAVALLLHEHLFVHALDPCLTITQVGLKAPDTLLDLPALCLTRQEDISSSSSYDTSLGTGVAWLGFLKFLELYYSLVFFSSVFFLFTLSSCFILRDVFINLKRCSFTKVPESTDQF